MKPRHRCGLGAFFRAALARRGHRLRVWAAGVVPVGGWSVGAGWPASVADGGVGLHRQRRCRGIARRGVVAGRGRHGGWRRRHAASGRGCSRHRRVFLQLAAAFGLFVRSFWRWIVFPRACLRLEAAALGECELVVVAWWSPWHSSPCVALPGGCRLLKLVPNLGHT